MFRSLSLVITSLLVVSLLTSCGTSPEGTEPIPTPQKGKPELVSRGLVKRAAKTNTHTNYEITVSLNIENTIQTYSFLSTDIPVDNNSNLLGSTYPTKQCKTSSCKEFETEKSLPSAVVRCNDKNCDSLTATISGFSTPLETKVVTITYNFFENLRPTLKGYIDGKDKVLEKPYKTVNNNMANTIGSLEISKVEGTSIYSALLFTETTPTWNHDVFKGLSHDTDVTKLPEYFITTLGGRFERNADRAYPISEFFSSTVYPNKSLSEGFSLPVNIRFSGNPERGSVGISIILAKQDDWSSLTLGFMSDKLLGFKLENIETNPSSR